MTKYLKIKMKIWCPVWYVMSTVLGATELVAVTATTMYSSANFSCMFEGRILNNTSARFPVI
jgi:hypothetical protein